MRRIVFILASVVCSGIHLQLLLCQYLYFVLVKQVHLSVVSRTACTASHTSAYVKVSRTACTASHTSAYASIRQSVANCTHRIVGGVVIVLDGVMHSIHIQPHSLGDLSSRIRQHTSAYVSISQHTSAYVSIRQHTPAYASIRQHTPAYASIRQHT
jgi:hypothetical protein